MNLVWMPVDGNLKLTWNVNWLTKDEQNWWNIRVDAGTGMVLDENNWITECHPASLENTEKINHTNNLTLPGSGEGMGEGNSGAKYNVLPRPVESLPRGSYLRGVHQSHGVSSASIFPSRRGSSMGLVS